MAVFEKCDRCRSVSRELLLTHQIQMCVFKIIMTSHPISRVCGVCEGIVELEGLMPVQGVLLGWCNVLGKVLAQ